MIPLIHSVCYITLSGFAFEHYDHIQKLQQQDAVQTFTNQVLKNIAFTYHSSRRSNSFPWNRPTFLEQPFEQASGIVENSLKYYVLA